MPGVGRAKLEAYGAAFVDAISGYADAHGLAATEELLEATDRPASGKPRIHAGRHAGDAVAGPERGGDRKGARNLFTRRCWGTSSAWRTGARRWRCRTCSWRRSG